MRTHVAAALIVALLLGPGAPASVVCAQSAAAPAGPQQKPRRAAPPQRAAHFDDLAQRADAARESNRLEDAIELYAQALKLKPAWAEGQWYLGAAAYELDRHQQARDAFRRVTQLSPQNGAAWTFLGLCEFQLKNYEDALAALMKGREIGGTGNKQLVSVARYHMAIMQIRNEQYEQALQLLQSFAVEGDDGPRIIEAMGLAALRMPLLPADVPGSKRDIVMLAGRATYYTAARFNVAAQKAFEELVTRYPETPNVHYAYGVFLTGEQPDAAIEQYKAELRVSPRHPWTKMQLAFEYMRRAEWENARPWAEQAVEEAPNVFVARRALGQVLLETGDVEGAVRELELGAKMAPDSPAMRFALARAYRRAGRTAEAEKEQAEFARLDRLSRTQKTGAQSVGGVELDSEGATRPSPQ